MKQLVISKQSVRDANRILVEKTKTSTVSNRRLFIRFSASEINSAYKKVLANGKKI